MSKSCFKVHTYVAVGDCDKSIDQRHVSNTNAKSFQCGDDSFIRGRPFDKHGSVQIEAYSVGRGHATNTS